MEKRKISLFDGLLKQNIVLISGLLVAPVIACATTLMKSLAVCLVFSLVSFLTITVCRAVPRKISYTIRVIIYSFAASAFYIPVYLFAKAVFTDAVIASAGVYLPILVTNSLILSKTESRFYSEPVTDMIIDSAVFILGFDITCIVIGTLRELIAVGTVGGIYIPMPFSVPALETTFGGFLMIGVFAGILRGIFNRRKAKLLEAEKEGNEESLVEYAEDMGEFLSGKKHHDTEKIRIYHSGKKKKKREPVQENLLEMEFHGNTDIVDEFAAIVAEVSALSEPNGESSSEASENQSEGGEEE